MRNECKNVKLPPNTSPPKTKVESTPVPPIE